MPSNTSMPPTRRTRKSLTTSEPASQSPRTSTSAPSRLNRLSASVPTRARSFPSAVMSTTAPMSVCPMWMVPLTVMYDGDWGAGAIGNEFELVEGAVDSLHDVLVTRQAATRTGTIRVEYMGGSSKGYQDVVSAPTTRIEDTGLAWVEWRVDCSPSVLLTFGGRLRGSARVFRGCRAARSFGHRWKIQC